MNKIIANGEVSLNYNVGKSSPISAIQGTTLAGLIFEGYYHWNEQSEGQAIINNGIDYQFGKECFISVLKPNISDLEKLGKKWKIDLKKSKYSFVLSNTIVVVCQQMEMEIMKRYVTRTIIQKK